MGTGREGGIGPILAGLVVPYLVRSGRYTQSVHIDGVLPTFAFVERKPCAGLFSFADDKGSLRCWHYNLGNFFRMKAPTSRPPVSKTMERRGPSVTWGT